MTSIRNEYCAPIASSGVHEDIQIFAESSCYLFIWPGLRDFTDGIAHCVCLSQRKRDTVTVYWWNIIFTTAQAISETIKTYCFVSTHYIIKVIKKVFVFFVRIGIKDNAVRINSDIRLCFASSFKYYSISATYFEKAFIMQQTLVLSNYRSSKVTLIFLSMYKITVAWHGIDLNGMR